MVKVSSSLETLLPSTPLPLLTCPATALKTSLLMELSCALLRVSPSSGYHTEGSSLSPGDCLSPLLDWESLEDELERLLSSDEHRHLLTPSPLPLDSYINYSTSSTQLFLCMKDVTFYVGAEGPATLRDLEQVAVTIMGPTGCSLPVLQFTSLSDDSVAVTFRPFLPGFHTIEVFHGVEHIKGCPAQMLISRNYTESSLRAVVSWDHRPVLQAKPWGLSCNTNTEQLWMADREQNEILVFRPDGSLDFSFGRLGTGPGEFSRPTAIAYDALKDRFLITDKDNHRVQIFNPRGDLLGCFGSKGSRNGQFAYPWGIAISPDGSLIAVADSRNHRIQFFHADGSYLRQFRVAHNIRNWREFKHLFDYPRGLAFDLTGDILYITDFNLHTVFSLHVPSLTLAPLVSPGLLLRPSGLAVDNAGNLIVADNKHNSLQLFSPQGVHLKTISTLSTSSHSSSSPHNIHQPTDVTIMKAGYIAMLDNNSRITIF
jgi:tripartite motif-containing protein 71